MTFWILLVIAGGLTYISMRWRNLFYTLGAVLGWLSLWVYNQNYPPTNIVVGSFIHEVMYYAFIVMAIGVFLVYLGNRRRGYTGFPMTKHEESEIEERSTRNRPTRGLMDLPPDQYKAYIRSRIRRRRR